MLFAFYPLLETVSSYFEMEEGRVVKIARVGCAMWLRQSGAPALYLNPGTRFCLALMH